MPPEQMSTASLQMSGVEKLKMPKYVKKLMGGLDQRGAEGFCEPIFATVRKSAGLEGLTVD